MANPAYRSSTSAAAQSGSTFTVNKPTGTIDGDLLVAFQATAKAGGADPVAPSGWSLLSRQAFASGSSSDLVCWYKVAASEGASWTFNGPAGGLSPSSSVYVVAFSGPPAAAPEGHTKASGSGTSADPGSYTTLAGNEVLFGAWAVGINVAESITPHASFTALGIIGDGPCRVNVGYKTQVAAGASVNTDATLGASLTWGAFLAAVAPVAVAAPVADFTMTPLTGQSPLTSTGTDTSTNTPTSWLWEKQQTAGGWQNFAGSPTAQNPAEVFDSGTWSVRLTATNAGGSDTKTRTDYIANIAPTPPAPSGGTGSGPGSYESVVAAAEARNLAAALRSPRGGRRVGQPPPQQSAPPPTGGGTVYDPGVPTDWIDPATVTGPDPTRPGPPTRPSGPGTVVTGPGYFVVLPDLPPPPVQPPPDPWAEVDSDLAFGRDARDLALTLAPLLIGVTGGVRPGPVRPGPIRLGPGPVYPGPRPPFNPPPLVPSTQVVSPSQILPGTQVTGPPLAPTLPWPSALPWWPTMPAPGTVVRPGGSLHWPLGSRGSAIKIPEKLPGPLPDPFPGLPPYGGGYIR